MLGNARPVSPSPLRPSEQGSEQGISTHAGKAAAKAFLSSFTEPPTLTWNLQPAMAPGEVASASQAPSFQPQAQADSRGGNRALLSQDALSQALSIPLPESPPKEQPPPQWGNEDASGAATLEQASVSGQVPGGEKQRDQATGSRPFLGDRTGAAQAGFEQGRAAWDAQKEEGEVTPEIWSQQESTGQAASSGFVWPEPEMKLEGQQVKGMEESHSQKPHDDRRHRARDQPQPQPPFAPRHATIDVSPSPVLRPVRPSVPSAPERSGVAGKLTRSPPQHPSTVYPAHHFAHPSTAGGTAAMRPEKQGPTSGGPRQAMLEEKLQHMQYMYETLRHSSQAMEADHRLQQQTMFMLHEENQQLKATGEAHRMQLANAQHNLAVLQAKEQQLRTQLKEALDHAHRSDAECARLTVELQERTQIVRGIEERARVAESQLALMRQKQQHQHHQPHRHALPGRGAGLNEPMEASCPEVGDMNKPPFVRSGRHLSAPSWRSDAAGVVPPHGGTWLGAGTHETMAGESHSIEPAPSGFRTIEAPLAGLSLYEGGEVLGEPPLPAGGVPPESEKDRMTWQQQRLFMAAQFQASKAARSGEGGWQKDSRTRPHHQHQQQQHQQQQSHPQQYSLQQVQKVGDGHAGHKQEAYGLPQGVDAINAGQPETAGESQEARSSQQLRQRKSGPAGGTASAYKGPSEGESKDDGQASTRRDRRRERSHTVPYGKGGNNGAWGRNEQPRDAKASSSGPNQPKAEAGQAKSRAGGGREGKRGDAPRRQKGHGQGPAHPVLRDVVSGEATVSLSQEHDDKGEECDEASGDRAMTAAAPRHAARGRGGNGSSSQKGNRARHRGGKPRGNRTGETADSAPAVQSDLLSEKSEVAKGLSFYSVNESTPQPDSAQVAAAAEAEASNAASHGPHPDEVAWRAALSS